MNTNSDEYIVLLKEEQEDSYSNDDLYNITSWGADLSFRELITMYKEEELLKPELQRKYVWDKAEASRFVESILLGLPIPSIFLANTPDEKKLIIDGYQRIMTIVDYVEGIWKKDEKIFRLSNTEKINEKWRGKSFSDLKSTDQRRIKQTTIHAIVFEQKAPKDNDTSLYQIFERINTGGRALMPQEIRNCVNQGAFNDLLFKLNKNPNWRLLFGKSAEDERMRDIEYLLRYFALEKIYNEQNLPTVISLKKYLNEFMGHVENQMEEIINQRENKFNKAIYFIKNNIGENAFFNIGTDDRIRKRFYPTIFDAICVGTSIALNLKGDDINILGLEQRRISMLKDPEFKKYSSEGTMSIDHINGRIKKVLFYLFDINE